MNTFEASIKSYRVPLTTEKVSNCSALFSVVEKDGDGRSSRGKHDDPDDSGHRWLPRRHNSPRDERKSPRRDHAPRDGRKSPRHDHSPRGGRSLERRRYQPRGWK